MASHVLQPHELDETKAGIPMFNIWVPIAVAILSVLLSVLSVWRAV